MPRSVLLMMSQLPQDPASGAPRSDRTICEFLAAAGFRVRALATTATEQKEFQDPISIFRDAGITPHIDEGPKACGPRPVYRFRDRGIDYTILDVGDCTMDSWLWHHNDQYNALLEKMLDDERPDILDCYGGLPQERARRRLIRERGAAVVFHVHNWSYFNSHAFHDIDAVMTPSRFVTDKYREKIGLDSTPFPIPIDEDDVIPLRRNPTYVTFINPSVSKGAGVVARVVEEICRKRSDIPFLIVNARGTAVTFTRMGLNGGFDLRKYPQIHFTEGTTKPRDIYAVTKILLVPSVWEEPAGRVSAEAIINSIPAIVSNRGGMGEVLAGGGYVLPIPESHTHTSTVPLTAAEASEWVEAIEYIWDTPEEYARACWRAAAAGVRYRRAVVAPQFVEFFMNVRKTSRPVIRP